MTDAPSTTANIVHLLVGRWIDCGRGDDPAVIDDDGMWTFRELDAAAARFAGALRERGVTAGNRVAVVLPDSRAWCAAFLGAQRIGAVAAPFEPHPPRLPAAFAAFEPAIVVAESELELPDGVARISPQEGDGGPPEPVHPVLPTDLAYMIFSSGSTGAPKGAMHAHRDVIASIEGYGREVLALGPGDRTLSVAKCMASLGFGNGFFRPLGRGACAVLTRRRPTVRLILAEVARNRVTVLSGVPTFWSQLSTFLERHPDESSLESLRLAVSSGDSLPAVVLERMRGHGVDVIEGFGCSECSNIVLSVRPGEHLPGTVGRPVSGVELKLADDDGTPVPEGTPGRLWIRSPSNTFGYFRRPEETADVVHGEWLRMGDVLKCEDGVFRHVGRRDDMFKVDGRWVSPVELEGVILRHEAVEEAAVVGLPQDDGLVRTAAFLRARDDVTVDRTTDRDIRRLVAHAVGTFASPQFIRWLDELPRGATGKVDRRRLRLDAS